MAANLQNWFPWTTPPFIANAPMLGSAESSLAASVTKAGGLGFIGGGFDFTTTSLQIPTLRSELANARKLLQLEIENVTLPVGVGFLLLRPENFLQGILPVLREYRPAAVWLFAVESRHVYTSVIPSLSKEGEAWGMKLFVQVGSVNGAREAIEDGTDVVVVQGTDAGGHQFAHGSGLMTLLPEVVDMVNDDFKDSHVSVVAAGGIMDGRGVAAAQVLGAEGVVMGTRFLATSECDSPEVVKTAVVSATDGAKSTIKSTVHDDIQGTAFWPADMDGRAIIGESYRDSVSGIPIDDNVAKYKKADESGDSSREIIWAGAGVGLVKAIVSAEEVVKSSQKEASRVFQNMALRN